MRRIRRARVALPLAVLIAIALAACSGGGAASAPSAGTRTVKVTTTDQMRFEPSAFEFVVGETVMFEVTNVGKIEHEFYVGTPEEQLAHEEEMKAGHSMHGHENSISVDPGQTGTLQLTFARAGSLEVGCHVIGHWDAGMRATITVRQAGGSATGRHVGRGAALGIGAPWAPAFGRSINRASRIGGVGRG